MAKQFLAKVVSDLLAKHPAWTRVHEDARHQHVAIGRSMGDRVFVYLDFSAMGKRDVVTQGVGWAPSEAVFRASLSRKETEPLRARDGSLARLGKLERPRDFEHEEMRVDTSSLCRPFGGFDLTEQTVEHAERQMLDEIDSYALPYLCMMLKARHGIELTPAQIWTVSETVSETVNRRGG